jgi:hypothetical protein
MQDAQPLRYAVEDRVASEDARYLTLERRKVEGVVDQSGLEEDRRPVQRSLPDKGGLTNATSPVKDDKGRALLFEFALENAEILLPPR